MAMAKRIFLFLAVNILVITTVSIVLSLLGVQPYLNEHGINYEALMVFCLVWGMGGAFISLMLSKIMAKWMMGVRIIDPNTLNAAERELVFSVHNMAKAAGLRKMPEVGIYQSPEVNAFATGPTRNNSLVAVSTGLLQRMGKTEVEGVLGHEVAHIANGDMVTMTLVQGVVNAFVMFLARVLAYAIITFLSRGRDSQGAAVSGLAYYAIVFVLQMILMVFAMIIIAAFSRYREFRADAGGARLAGREKMIAALEGLKKTYNIQDERVEEKHASVAAFKISGRKSKFAALFSTHPPLDVRIERLRMGA